MVAHAFDEVLPYQPCEQSRFTEYQLILLAIPNFNDSQNVAREPNTAMETLPFLYFTGIIIDYNGLYIMVSIYFSLGL